VKIKIFLIITCLIFCKLWLNGQNLEGVVLYEVNNQPQSGVNVYIISEDHPLDSTTTNSAGYFIFNNVEVGRYDVSFVSATFEPVLKPAILVNNSKATFLEIYLKKSFTILDEVTVMPEKNNTQPVNNMSTLSTLTLQVEDARKFAGGLDDPLRAATNLAGVHSNGAFSDNFISIRGNSPRALKYYFEGIELPNPTHFARIGSAGGTFTIFSIQLLANSDLFTGAFPAEYSNSIGGIFDVKFRKGNTQKHEWGFQAGTLGLDAWAEGPLQKGKKASYLANFRYAMVGLARLIGYPTQPTYTDLSFNLNFPLSKTENLKIYSIIGGSDRIRSAVKDTALWEEGLDRYELTLNSKLISLGSTYTKLLKSNTLLKASLLGAYTQQQDNKIFLLHSLNEIERSINEYQSFPFSFALSVKHPYSSRLVVYAGTSTSFTNHQYTFFQTNDTIISQLTKNISLNTGLHFIYHTINQEFLAEPRFGIRYQMHPKHSLSFAYGKHSQAEEYAVYQYNISNEIKPNQNLRSTKSHHFALAYQAAINTSYLLQVEAYYQNLFDVPIEANGTFSTLNLSELNDIRTANNSGKGKNYGIDAGFKRNLLSTQMPFASAQSRAQKTA